jgi:poly(A) polymerase
LALARENKIREAILEGDIPNEREAAINFTIEKGKEIGLKVAANTN